MSAPLWLAVCVLCGLLGDYLGFRRALKAMGGKHEQQ